MPSDDVSDLRDVVDAINKLCDTMKTSSYDEEFDESESAEMSQSPSIDLLDPLVAEEVVPEEAILAEVEADPDWYVACQIEPTDPSDIIFKKVDHYNTETWRQSVSRLEVASPEDVVVSKPETYVAELWKDVQDREQRETRDRWSDPSSSLDVVSPETAQKPEAVSAERWSDPSSKLDIVSPEEILQKAEISAERWSDSSVSLPGQVEEETVTSDERQAQLSEMYYTASSEVSLLSDLEVADKPQEETVVEKDDDRKECVIAGHVAAMRERFESMTRTNTPCPDLMRSVSPALDVFRNITPSPDHLG